MFWAITCESGMRYSQIPTDAFHVSMAALEPKDELPENKQVSLMIEHGGKEFLLCTLEYDRVMQVSLDLQFNKGEEMFFFVNGDGTIHLSGYVDADADFDQKFEDPGDMSINCNVNDVESDIESAGENDAKNELSTSRLLTLDDSEEEDSEDYDPESEFNEPNDSDEEEEEDSSSELDEDLSLEMSSDEATEEITAGKRRKAFEAPGPSSKRSRNSSLASADPQEPSSSGFKKQKKKQSKSSVEHILSTASMETHPSTSYVDDDILNSSIGNTPMPKKSGVSKTSSQLHESFTSPNFHSNSKYEQKDKQQSTAKKANIVKLSESNTKKLSNGVEIRDIKMGNGPVAKKGKFVHVYYIGRLDNNQIFDSAKPGANKPLSFRLGKDEVIKGWDIGIQGMRVGGKRYVKVPPEMGYGKKGSGPIPGNSTLHFTIELKAVS